MNDNFQSEYKDTESVRKYVNRQNIYSLLFALGFFIIIISIIPYLLITSEKIEDRILPSIIVFLIGLIMVISSNFSKRKLRDKQANKYTVAASEFIDLETESRRKIFRKDLIISILLIILVPIIYYLIHKKTSMIATNSNKYINSILILIIAIAVFIILYSKGKKDAYNSLH
ncbi:hypothetical protein ACKRLN_05195 [Anaerococcus sp. DFU013_CI05]|uniref:hypothetical protein n=1 Tax=Anaerococcus sp. AH8042_DFU013_CI05 TaxID=3385202 RepID=UPI003A520E8E